MIVAMSRFRVANEMQSQVEQAFINRPHLVDTAAGFLGMETFTETTDTAVFYLVTRWTDAESFHVWHRSEAHHKSHGSIPKGLKLDPSYTKVVELERICGTARLAGLEEVVLDQSALLAAFLKDSESNHLIAASNDGMIVCCNNAVARRLRFTVEDLTGKKIWDLLTETDAASLREKIARGERKPGDPFLLNFVDAAQSPHTILCHMDMQPDGFIILGEPRQRQDDEQYSQLMQINNEFSVLTRENTRKKRELEAALSKLKDTQALLVHSEKMAALGQMTAGVAHEINNPLAFVLSNHGTLRKDFADLLSLINLIGDSLDELAQASPGLRDRILEKAEEIELTHLAEAIPRKIADNLEGLERVKEIVLDLRRFSRLDEDVFKFADVNRNLTSTLRFLTPLIHERGVIVRTEFDDRLPLLMCSPGALNQAFSNVIANGIQASRPGQEVMVSTSVEGNRCIVTVEDHGSGISPGDLSKVFDPFFTTKPVGEGTGLGLHITQQIITAHHGEIKITSTPAQGTTVRIELPLQSEKE